MFTVPASLSLAFEAQLVQQNLPNQQRRDFHKWYNVDIRTVQKPSRENQALRWCHQQSQCHKAANLLVPYKHNLFRIRAKFDERLRLEVTGPQRFESYYDIHP